MDRWTLLGRSKWWTYGVGFALPLLALSACGGGGAATSPDASHAADAADAPATADAPDARTNSDGTNDRPSASCGIVALALGDEHSCALDSTGAVTCWGGLINPAMTFPTPIPPTTVTGIPAARQIAAAGGENCLIDAAGALTCWRGGAGAIQVPPASKPLPAGEVARALALGPLASCVRASGLGYCWGYGTYGQLGDGTYDSSGRDAPAPIDDTDGVARGAADLSMGDKSACAIRGSDRSVWCWGDGERGQLGTDRLGPSVAVPMPVPGLGPMAQVVVGSGHACARDAAGAVYCWGRNDAAQLGDGTTSSRALPGVVAALPGGVVQLVSNGSAAHTCAIKNDQTLWCWGSNLNYQLGEAFLGVTPTMLMANVRQVSLGASHTCAIKSDGTVWCWGSNSAGQLGGDDPPSQRQPPRQVVLPCAGPAPPPPDGGAFTDGGAPFPDGGVTSHRDAGDAALPPGGPWSDRTPPVLPFVFPNLRPGAAMTYDRARGRTVLVTGTEDDLGVHQLWEWDGVGAWSNRTPAHHPLMWPQLVYAPILAFDEARNRTILRGSDRRAWEWDGSGTFSERTPLPLPAIWLPDGNVSVVYDVARSQLVGYELSWRRLWRGDLGTNQWSVMELPFTNAAPLPNPSDPTVWVYDRRRGVDVMMFQSSPQFEIWDWNGSTWRDRTPRALGAVVPSVASLGAAFDEVRGTVIIADRGGIGQPSRPGTVWEWNGDDGSFTQRASSTTASVWPPVNGHAVIYDSARHKVISYAPASGFQPDADCWEWDSATASWTNRTPPATAGGWLDNGEGGVTVADPTRGRVLTFSAQPGPVVAASNHDLYEWQGDRWTLRTPVPRPAIWPPDRIEFSAVVDPDRDRLILYGGVDTKATTTIWRADLWELNLATMTWTDRTPATLPAVWPDARAGQAMTYDSARRRIVMFGGRVGALDPPPNGANHIWEWDGASGTWADRAPPDGATWPPGYESMSLVYDSVRARALIFGGGGIFSPSVDDLWEWDGARGVFENRGARPRPTSWPPARWRHAAAFDPVRRLMIVFGGYSAGAGDDTWEWDGATGTWTRRATRTLGPRARQGAGMAFDAGRNRVVLVGGAIAGGYDDVGTDTWEYDGNQPD